MQLFSQLFIVILVLIGFIITSLNTAPTTFNYYLSTTQIPLSLLILFSFGIGWLIGLGFSLSRYIKLKSAHRRLQYQHQQLETEINHLKVKELTQEEAICL